MDDQAIVLADASGVIRYWSPGAEALFGFSGQEAVGRTLDLIVPSEYREAHWAGFQRAVQTGAAAVEGQTTPFPARHAGGEILPRPGRLTLVRRPRGDVVAALVVFE
jgi:PAS domain S-box-containing protein